MLWNRILLLTIAATSLILLAGFTYKQAERRAQKKLSPKGCVFRTVMGEEGTEGYEKFKTPEKVMASLHNGLSWMARAQHDNGGWGAGSHARQNIRDPHAVPADPATTSIVMMAMLRSGNTFYSGEYKTQVRSGLEYLLRAVEESPTQSNTITTQTGTQIQMKLGQNIDVILTAQCLSNSLDYLHHDAALRTRVKKALDVCVAKIQQSQDSDGSIRGAGWAGVLQSSLANNALESAQTKGAAVDASALDKAREYQKQNYDPRTGNANTDKGAGIVLYSVTGSVRASAKEARQVKEEVEKAKRDGRLPAQAPVNAENLSKIGYASDDAMKYATAYEVYESAKVKSQQEDVMNGFGSNGGEEFLSYLQTGESMIINKDDSWQKWYDAIAGKLIKIQTEDGSWHGHHCITSPVFCTATCLLILSVQEDADKLIQLGGK